MGLGFEVEESVNVGIWFSLPLRVNFLIPYLSSHPPTINITSSWHATYLITFVVMPPLVVQLCHHPKTQKCTQSPLVQSTCTCTFAPSPLCHHTSLMLLPTSINNPDSHHPCPNRTQTPHLSLFRPHFSKILKLFVWSNL